MKNMFYARLSDLFSSPTLKLQWVKLLPPTLKLRRVKLLPPTLKLRRVKLLLPTLKLRRVKLLLLPLLLLPLLLTAQVSTVPVFPNVNANVTIYYNATQGNAALADVSPVFAHMGVITNLSNSPSDWKHVPTTWGINDPVGAMTQESPNVWKKTINIQTFFNISGGETVLKLAFVFRNQSGSIVGRAADGGDIFYDVYPENGPLQTVFLQPNIASFLSAVGMLIPVKAAASQSGELVLYDNGTQVATANGESLETNLTASAGLHLIKFVAITASESDTSSFLYLVPSALNIQNPPAGSQAGISYLDDQTVRLALYAPKKQVVYAIGDFSNWLPNPAYQMNLSADSTLWWIEIGGLTPGQDIRFQYLVNGTLRFADPLSTMVLDAGNDPFIPTITYPNLSVYPTGQTSGSVSVLQTNQTPFPWSAASYERPKKTDLVVYELLLRDFLARHDYATLLDTLDYLERLGVTAIELMPVNEFDGNNSWGYNPAFHKALDKYYGTPEALKLLIDECHARNIAVILDVVFNQASGSSPLAQLYWDAANNRPAVDNPWLNPIAKHDFNVFNDFNHESQATKSYVKNCLLYWVSEFKVDGFRFDLSKGFTQNNTLGNVSAWGQYDASRIVILKDYADAIWDEDPTAYVILEHFANNNEEKVLAQYGMMLWGNMHGAYKDVALGTTSGLTANMSGISYKNRTWTVPHLIGYMESHDEERIMVDCYNSGAVAANYNVKTTPIALKRIEMLNNLLYTVPGPKMLWEFGEMGYDFSINLCENGTVNNNCRLSPKPIRWDYYDMPKRRALFVKTAALLQLRKNYDVFETTDFQISLGSGKIRTVRLNSPTMNVFVVANAAVTTETATGNFQHTGTWYEYYTGAILNVTNLSTPISLTAGEYRLYTDVFVPFPDDLQYLAAPEVAGAVEDVAVYPNPASSIFTVYFNLRESTDVQVQVLDMSGKTIGKFDGESLPPGEQAFEIDANNWQTGVYFVMLRDRETGAVITKKVIKQ